MLPWGVVLHTEGTRANLWHLQVPLNWSSGLAAGGSSHTFRPWDFLQVFRAPQLNLVRQTVPFLTHKRSKTGEKPCSKSSQVCFKLLLSVSQSERIQTLFYQIILKLVRHQVYTTANTAPFRNHLRGLEDCLYNTTALFVAHKMNWRDLRCAEGKGVASLTDNKQWKVS